MTGPEVKSLRKQLGVSMSRMAAVLGVTKTSVQNWEARGAPGTAGIALLLIREKRYLWTWLVKHASESLDSPNTS